MTESEVKATIKGPFYSSPLLPKSEPIEVLQSLLAESIIEDGLINVGSELKDKFELHYFEEGDQHGMLAVPYEVIDELDPSDEDEWEFNEVD